MQSQYLVYLTVSIFTVSVNTTSRTLLVLLSSTTCFGRFLPLSRRFYNNMHEKEYRGGGLRFTVGILKYIKFNSLLSYNLSACTGGSDAADNVLAADHTVTANTIYAAHAIKTHVAKEILKSPSKHVAATYIVRKLEDLSRLTVNFMSLSCRFHEKAQSSFSYIMWQRCFRNCDI